jgi:hypothetical protein
MAKAIDRCTNKSRSDKARFAGAMRHFEQSEHDDRRREGGAASPADKRLYHQQGIQCPMHGGAARRCASGMTRLSPDQPLPLPERCRL